MKDESLEKQVFHRKSNSKIVNQSKLIIDSYSKLIQSKQNKAKKTTLNSNTTKNQNKPFSNTYTNQIHDMKIIKEHSPLYTQDKSTNNTNNLVHHPSQANHSRNLSVSPFKVSKENKLIHKKNNSSIIDIHGYGGHCHRELNLNENYEKGSQILTCSSMNMKNKEKANKINSNNGNIKDILHSFLRSNNKLKVSLSIGVGNSKFNIKKRNNEKTNEKHCLVINNDIAFSIYSSKSHHVMKENNEENNDYNKSNTLPHDNNNNENNNSKTNLKLQIELLKSLSNQLYKENLSLKQKTITEQSTITRLSIENSVLYKEIQHAKAMLLHVILKVNKLFSCLCDEAIKEFIKKESFLVKENSLMRKIIGNIVCFQCSKIKNNEMNCLFDMKKSQAPDEEFMKEIRKSEYLIDDNFSLAMKKIFLKTNNEIKGNQLENTQKQQEKINENIRKSKKDSKNQCSIVLDDNENRVKEENMKILNKLKNKLDDLIGNIQ